MNYALNISWLYPDLMSTYGDRGNIIVLQKRCQWRGIEVKIQEVTLETPISKLQTADLLFMGGAQDRQQKIAGDDFLKVKGPMIKTLIEKGVPALFVCAAIQAVGHWYEPYQREKIVYPGIFDLYTKHPGDQAKRLIGNVTAEIINPVELAGLKMVGFENHGGRTYLGAGLKPFARVKDGFGNNGEDGFEGAVYKNAIGCYLHGPLLPKNPQIADWLITKALERKYKKEIKLTKLDDTLEHRARKSVIEKMEK
jgi:hypothetical protein